MINKKELIDSMQEKQPTPKKKDEKKDIKKPKSSDYVTSKYDKTETSEMEGKMVDGKPVTTETKWSLEMTPKKIKKL